MPVPALISQRARRAAAVLAVLLAVHAGGASARAEPPPTPQAAAWLVYAPGQGGYLASHGIDDERAVASLTKLMTAHLTLRAARLHDVTTVGQDAATVGESMVPMREGERQSLRDLLEALVVRSANDAAVALADAVGGSQAAFVDRMNAEARRLGLRHSQYSSARDVLTLSRLDMQSPVFRSFAGARSGAIPGHSFTARNTLLAVYPGSDGVKTGNTDDAGWCLSASAVRGPIRLFVVVLGEPSQAQRDLDVARLLDWGFDRYHQATLVTAGARFGTLEEAYTGRRVNVLAGSTVERVVRPEERFEQKVELPARAPSPLRRGQRLGTLSLLQHGAVVARVPLVSSGTLAAPGTLDRGRWLSSHTWQNLLGVGGLLAVVGAVGPLRSRRRTTRRPSRAVLVRRGRV
jgi:D-alanyl-D-alanine carboxypeptidase (penicillin-binding protein 5/6)